MKFKFEKLNIWQMAMDFEEDKFGTLYNEAFHLMNMMNAFRNNIK